MRAFRDRIVGRGESPLTPDDVEDVVERLLDRKEVPARLLFRVIRALQGRIEDLEADLDRIRDTVARAYPEEDADA